jgi:hypothetical protein
MIPAFVPEPTVTVAVAPVPVPFSVTVAGDVYPEPPLFTNTPTTDPSYAAPNAASELMRSVPAEIVVPPLYRFALVSVSVPDPCFVSDATANPFALDSTPESVLLNAVLIAPNPLAFDPSRNGRLESNVPESVSVPPVLTVTCPLIVANALAAPLDVVMVGSDVYPDPGLVRLNEPTVAPLSVAVPDAPVPPPPEIVIVGAAV